MTAPVHFALTNEAFGELHSVVERQIDTSVRFPDWPFLARSGFVTIYEYGRVLGGGFGAVLEALVSTYGDQVVTTVGLEPAFGYYRDSYSHSPGFHIPADSVGEGYWAGLGQEPGGDPTGALIFTLNVFGIVGSSGAWSVWAQRDWEIGLLLTPDSAGPWLEAPVTWFGRDIDLDEIRSPPGWGVPLGEQELSTFWRHVKTRGSG